ncbi:TonB-dependent receptor domain-containing protein [Pedomonas mirosovicensis]|uniref:TonB-dependent receptor domain-containing protein n=1 Tax=Pedomonas mirosovicensis TaxID=2908641 RepID=UPI002169D28B|nr:TonB-dependent receptor [Pedomonas mirosovicensis]MCH8686350.1 TonB-dependent receptor [Pedomonas mirosovicensis]
MASTIWMVPIVELHAQQAAQTPQPEAFDELLVQGEYIPDEKRATSEISNILDAEDFKITGDSDIGSALQRVTGLSLVDGKFVFVRGLGERYSSVLLDGASLPSPEPLRRVVPLDIFPTALLGSALVQKSYSPQYPAEFGGGVLELRTRAVPEERFFSISLSTAYNTESTFKKGLGYDGHDLDFTGFGGSKRKIPDIIANNYPLSNLSPEQLEQAGEALPNVWSLDEEPNMPQFTGELVYGDRFELGEKNLGIIAAVRYDSKFQNEFGTRSRYTTSDAGPVVNENISPEVCESYEGATGCGYRRSDWTIGLNGILSLGLELDDANAIKYTTLLLRKTDRISEIYQGEFASDPGTLRNRSGFDWIEQQVWTNQLSGEHAFEMDGATFGELKLDWRAVYSQASREVKLRRDYTYDFDENSQVWRNRARPDGNRTSFGGLDDTNIEGGFDFDQELALGAIEMNLKGGAAYTDKERDSAFRRFYYAYPAGAHLELRERIPEIIFGPTNIDPNGFVLRENTDPSDFFDASMENVQGYGQLDIRLTPTLRLAAGARYEDSKQIVNTVDRATEEAIRTTLRGEYLLPAATATYEFAENMQVRAGYSQTISRPDLRELSSAAFIDERRRLTRGNPYLKITEIKNYDLRWEWYFGKQDSLTIGAFYKDFTNPIEWTYVPRGEGFIREPRNAPGAKLKGVEADVETYLPFFKGSSSEWLARKDFFVKANVAYIDSEIELEPGVETTANRSMQGQSDVLVNAQVGYDDPIAGERFALIFNFTGERIDDVGLLQAPNFVEKPPVMLNLTYARAFSLWGGEYEFSFEAENLLGDDFMIKQGDFVAEQYDIGRTFKIGISARY